MDKNKNDDKGYFGYNGVSPRDNEEEDESGNNKKKQDKKKKKQINGLPLGMRKQGTEMTAAQLSKQIQNAQHQGFKHHSVSSDNMVLGLKGAEERRGAKQDKSGNGKKKQTGSKKNK